MDHILEYVSAMRELGIAVYEGRRHDHFRRQAVKIRELLVGRMPESWAVARITKVLRERDIVVCNTDPGTAQENFLLGMVYEKRHEVHGIAPVIVDTRISWGLDMRENYRGGFRPCLYAYDELLFSHQALRKQGVPAHRIIRNAVEEYSYK